MVGCPRTRVTQQIDAKQPVHVVPVPCPLVAPAISISAGINQQASSVRVNASFTGSSAPAQAVDSLAAEPLPLREIDSVAKASGKSSPYVLGRKYSKHVVGMLRGLHDTGIVHARVLALLRLWLLPSRDPHLVELAFPAHPTAGVRLTDALKYFQRPWGRCSCATGLYRRSRKRGTEYVSRSSRCRPFRLCSSCPSWRPCRRLEAFY